MARIFRIVLTVLVLSAFALGSNCSDSGLGSHDDAFSDEHLLVADSGSLTTTVVSATTAERIAGKNVLWCGTMQLAWNELVTLLTGAVRLDPASAVTDELNRQGFTADQLDDASYVALAGRTADGIHERIGRELQRKFGGRARPRLLPDSSLTPRPQDIAVYAYLFKNLEFAHPLERHEGGLVFGGLHLVDAFGLSHKSTPEQRRQLQILDYRSNDDFVIALTPKQKGDRLILAKLAPGATLEATIQAVLQRAAAKPIAPADADVLLVPKLNFDITRRYDELVGRRLVNPPADKDLMQILECDQNIRFQMDEKGARVKSEMRMSIGCCAPSLPQPEHEMIFDKPFLILMIRDGAKHPYFALWIANADLLIASGK